MELSIDDITARDNAKTSVSFMARNTAAQQVVLRDHESRIKYLENTIESLMEEIKDLRSNM